MMLPSMRVMVRLAKNSPKNQSRMPEPASTHKSRLVMPVRCNGVMDALHPSTKNTLNRLLPTTLPMAISGFFLQGGYNGCGKFGQGCSACHQRQSDNRFAYSQAACNAACTVNKETAAGNKCSKPAQNVEDRLPKWQLPDSFLTAGCFFGTV